MRALPRALPLLLASVALASSQLELPLSERARGADRVVLAEVLGSRVNVPDGDHRRMTTITTVLVRERYKGEGPDRLELVQLGGTDGLWESRVPGDATFAAGETAILFLHCRDAAAPERCGLMGLADGKLAVEAAPAGGQEVRLRRERRSIESVVDEIRRALPVARPIQRGRR